MAVQKIVRSKGQFFSTKPTSENPHFLTEGDSGGPVYIRNARTRELEVVGINSMLAPANALQLVNMVTSSEPPRAASVYMRLAAHRAWYENVLRQMKRIN
jgi:hypothetical protein